MAEEKQAKSVDSFLGPIVFLLSFGVFIGLITVYDNPAMAIRDTGRFMQIGAIGIIVSSIAVAIVRKIRGAENDAKPKDEVDERSDK